MKRTIENKGEYFETDASQLLERFPDATKSSILVVKSPRVELAHAEKYEFLIRLASVHRALLKNDPYYLRMDASQKSDVVFRRLLLVGINEEDGSQQEYRNIVDEIACGKFALEREEDVPVADQVDEESV